MERTRTRRLPRVVLITAAVLLLGASAAEASRCYTYFLFSNTDREVPGHVSVECRRGADLLHSEPFGNWGVRSPHGNYYDGYEFSGWKDDDGWLQWNSCTIEPQFQTPEYLPDGRPQLSRGVPVNVYATARLRGPTNVPCDEVHRSGLFVASGLYMRVYELDSNWDLLLLGNGADWVDSLYFPTIHVPMQCESESNCRGLSSWTAPYDRWYGPIVESRIRVSVHTYYR